MHVAPPPPGPDTDKVRRVRAYDAELSRLQLPPNGDDYNAVLAILEDGVPRLPTAEGR